MKRTPYRRIRLLALSVILILITCACVLHGFAETETTTVLSGSCGQDVTFALTDAGTLTISGNGSMTNYTSSSNAPWYSSRSSIKTVIIEDGVTSIGAAAFYYYPNLKNVTIPKSVTSIESTSFYKCTSLNNVEFATTEGWYQPGSTYVPDDNSDIFSDDLADNAKAAAILTQNRALKRKNSNSYIDLKPITVFEAGKETDPLSFYLPETLPKINGYNGNIKGVSMKNAISLAGVNADGNVQVLTPEYGQSALEISEGYEYYLKLSGFLSAQSKIFFNLTDTAMEGTGIPSHIGPDGLPAYDLSEYDQLRIDFYIPESTYTLNPYRFIIILDCGRNSAGGNWSYIYVMPTSVQLANSENKGFYTAIYDFRTMSIMRTPNLKNVNNINFQFSGWSNGAVGDDGKNTGAQDNYDFFIKSIKLYGASNSLVTLPTGDESCAHASMTQTTVPSVYCSIGYSVYSCDNCGYKKIDNDYSKLQFNTQSHDYVVTEIVEPTCEANGYSISKCKYCSEEIENILVALGHDYFICKTEEPTCTEEGYNIYRCQDCSQQYKTSLPKLGHSYQLKITDDGTLLLACVRGDVITMPQMTTSIPTYTDLVEKLATDGNINYSHNLSASVFPTNYTITNNHYVEGDTATQTSARYGNLNALIRQGKFSVLSNGGNDNVDNYMRLESKYHNIQNYINAWLYSPTNAKIPQGTNITIEFSIRTEIRDFEPETYNRKYIEIIDRSGNAVFIELCSISPTGVLNFGDKCEYQLSDTKFTNIAVSIHPTNTTYDVYVDGILLGINIPLPANKHTDIKNLTIHEFRFNQYVSETWTDIANIIAYDSVCPKFIKGFQNVWTEKNEFVPDESLGTLDFKINHDVIGEIDDAWFEEYKNAHSASEDSVTEEQFQSSFSIETVEKDGAPVSVLTWQNFKSGSPHLLINSFKGIPSTHQIKNGNLFKKIYDLSGYDSFTVELYCDTVSEELINMGKNGYTFFIGFFSPSTNNTINYCYTLITVTPEDIANGEDGWIKFTIPFSELLSIRKGDLSAVTHFAIIANGWGRQGVGNGTVGSYLNEDENAVDGTVIKFYNLTIINNGTLYYNEPKENCNHDYSLRVEVPATCQTNGYIAQKCTKCGGEIPYTQTITPFAAHNIETLIDFPRTCNSTNAKIERCIVCDIKRTSRYIVLGHEYTTTVYEATCENDGYTTYACYCGATFERYDEVPALGHNYSDWVITTAPGYTTEGEKRRICAHDASHYISETIPVLVNKKEDMEFERDENGNIIGSGVWFGESDVVINDEGQINIGMGAGGNVKPNFNGAKLTKELIKLLVDKDMSLHSDYGEIIFDSKTMKKLAKHAGDVDMIVKIITTDEEATDGKVVYSFNVSGDGIELLPESTADENGNMKVTLFFRTGLNKKDVRVTYRSPNGESFDVNVQNYNPETGEVTVNAQHSAIFELSAVETDGTELKSASISIGTDLTLNIFANLGPESKDAKIRFTMNGESVTVEGVSISNSSLYRFSFEGITPQCMNDTVTVELICKNRTVETLEYSIRKYCDELISSTAEALNMSQQKYDAMITLALDLLNYGAESQIYRGYKVNALVTEGLDIKSEYVAAEYSDVKIIDGAPVDGVTFRSATLRFGNTNQLYFLFSAPDISKVSIMAVADGSSKLYFADSFEKRPDGTYMFGTDDIFATDFQDVYTLVMMYDGKIVQNLTYSVRSYVYSMQNKANNDGTLTDMARLARALWRYGQSAINYISIK